ncbi:ABC transporter substrate-binding protein [Mesobacillus thioparans]|uniref:ABC transporter substrate-binding protein n=1 Tax=Mesobacillus thioparans TaxID=370439 RepID=UPI0039EE6621
MDRYLLLLWNQVKSGAVKVEGIAEVLMLSTKQTRRKLQLWQEEGWLTFQSGRGRGNTSSLEWNRQVEQEYEDLFFKGLEKEPIESVSKLLLLDWSAETKQRLMAAFQGKLGFHQEGQDSLIIPRFYPFVTFHPLKLADAQSANIIANLYNRLVTLNADDSVEPELAHSWEYKDTQLLLYLRKDVAFHDGSILKAEDTVDCLQQMKQDENFADLWEPITEITTPSRLVVKLDFPGGCSYVLQLLGLLAASIFKEVNGRLLGTGGFYLAEESAEKTALSAFRQYYGYRPLLDRVEFIQVPKEFQVVYHAGHESKQVDTFKVESDSGFGIVVMNPYRSSDMARQEVRDYIHMVIDRHRDELQDVDGRIKGNNEGCLIGLSRSYDMPDRPKPSLTEPLKMNYVNYTTNTSFWLKEKLEAAGLDVEMKEVSFQDALYDPDVKMEADLFIHGEIFEMNQSFSYFFFLKNSFSPLHYLVERDEYLQGKLAYYTTKPFKQWNSLHLQIEQYMKDQSLCVPLYYIKRQIPFSINLMNIEIKHFGYVDLTKLWTKTV